MSRRVRPPSARGWLAAGWLCLALPAGAGELSLEAFLQAALDRNPRIQAILAAPGVAAGELLAARGIDDPVLRVEGSSARTQPNSLFGFEPSETRDQRLGLGLERVVSATGTRLSLDYLNQRTVRSPPLASVGTRFYQPSLTLRLTQPLLRNAGGVQDRLDRELAEAGLALARLQALEDLESTLTGLARLYLDWYIARREADILGAVYRKARAQERLVRLKVAREVAEPYELLRMREAREGYRARWRRARGRAEGLEARVRAQAGLGAARLRPAPPAGGPLAVAPPPGGAAYLETRSRLRAILDRNLERQRRLLAARRDARRPQVDLALSYRRHDLDASLDDALGSRLEKADYALGLVYRRPLGNRAARGRYAAQEAALARLEQDTRQRLLDARAALADLEARIHALEETLAALRRQVRLGREKLREEERLYRIGRLDLFQLLADQGTQLEQELALAQQQVELLRLRLDRGELLDRNLEPYRARLGARLP